MRSQEKLDKSEFNDTVLRFVDADEAVLRDALPNTVATSHM